MKTLNFIVNRICANTPPCCFKRTSRFVWTLIMMLTLGVGQMWADSYTWTCSGTTTFSTTAAALSGASSSTVLWTASQTGSSQGTGVSGEKCVQIPKTTGLTLSTSNISGTISNITIQTWGSQGNNLTCAVGAYSNTQSISTSYSSSGSTTSFTPNASGTITLTWASASKAFNVRSISITYSSAAPTKVATPSFSVAAGTYNESKSVTLSCTTAGATIRYTLDGSAPTSTSTAYSSAISVAESKTIKAKAFKSGMTDSDMATATYTIKCATPTFSVNAGTYNESKSVTLSTTYGTKIYYTTNGSNPTTSSTEYTGAITVSKTTTIKAIAWKSGCTNSEIASRTYTIQCATPTFSVNAGTYNESKSVTLSTTYGDKIYYTTNNTTPSTSSTLYEGAIAVNQTTTIKAIAWKEGCSNSSEASATYTLQCVAPTFNVAAGTYTGAQTVAISSTTPGVTIRYTTNGNNPSTNTGTVYSEPITVSSSQTVKAIAYKTNWSASTVASATYTIKYTVNWVVNGTTISTAEVAYNTTAALPTNPDPASYCGHKFMGWTTVQNHDGASAPSPLITSAPTITGNVTYYAVFGYYEE